MNRRDAIRLRVVNRRVACPFGRNDGNGGRDLHNCYLDSVTPDHPCVDPEGTGAKRCPQVEAWKQEIGLRTYYVAPEKTHVNEEGEPHHEHKVQIVYLSRDPEGLTWYAMNLHTGQREEVVLLPAEFRINQTTNTKEHIHSSARRVNPEGRAIEYVFTMIDSVEMDRRLKVGGMVTIPHLKPIWRGVQPREEWRCTCGSCTGRVKQRRTTMQCSFCKEPWPCSVVQHSESELETVIHTPEEVEELDPMASMRRGHQSGKPPVITSAVNPPRTNPLTTPSTPSKYFSGTTPADVQRARDKIRARNGMSASTRDYINRPVSEPRVITAPAPKPKPKAGPLTTADVLSSTFKKKTTKKIEK